MSHHFAKPENALRKALDLVKVNKDDAALRSLHSMLLSRRYRVWQPTHEQIMMLYVKLAVENRKNAKEGLLYYRNICQVKEVASLERIIKEFIRLAEVRAADAEAESKVPSPGGADVATASSSRTEHDIIGYRSEVQHFFVPGVGGEDDQDRSKREIVTPWLKYLWDTYRTVLEVMRNNQHLDKLYHQTVQKALSYCIVHQRTSEFRNLCDLIRKNLNTIINNQEQVNAVDISSPDTVQAFLRTRFAQLECASTLDQWQEAYRVIEDIHDLLLRAKVAIKLDQSLLSTYYQKLELIFWKSSNPLFHAYCVDKLFEFALASGSETETASVADRLVIAAVSIPLQSSALSSRSSYVDGHDQKNARLSAMLGFSHPPSRPRILEKLNRHNIVQHASDLVKQIFALMTNTRAVAPSKLASDALPLLEQISSIPHLSQYSVSLSKSIVLVLLQQFSRVYKVLRMDTFLELVPKSLSAGDIEQLIVLWVKDGLIRVRIDHHSNNLSFDPDLGSSTPYLKQLSSLASSLQICVDKIHPISQADKDLQRIQVFQLAKLGMDREHRDVFIRKQVIERRKQEAEMSAHRRERDEFIRAQQTKQRKMEDEQNRLQDEKARREKEREERAEKDRILAANLALIDKLKAAAAAAGESTTVKSRKIIDALEEDAENVDREKLIEAQQEVQSHEQRAKERKLKDDFKRLEYVNRAMRLEERPLLIEQQNTQRVVDKAYYDEQWVKHCALHRTKHEETVLDKVQLARMAGARDVFFQQIMDKRRIAHQAEIDHYNEILKQKEQERVEEIQRWALEEAENQRLEELAEQKRKEEEEIKAKAEEVRRKKQADLDAIEEKKRQKEQEIEDRKKANTTSNSEPWRSAGGIPVRAAANASEEKWRARGDDATARVPVAAAAPSEKEWRSSDGGSRLAVRDTWRRDAEPRSTTSRPDASGDNAWRRPDGDASLKGTYSRSTDASRRTGPSADSYNAPRRTQEDNSSARLKPAGSSKAPESNWRDKPASNGGQSK